MTHLELLVLAVGLSMDAFAVAVGLGLSLPVAGAGKAAVVGLYFGAFQAIMPVIGFFAGMFFAERFVEYGMWISCGLLVFLGGKMIRDGFAKDDGEEKTASLAPKVMLPFAIATSIDAMAVGVSFAFLQVNIALAAVVIGVITFAVSAAGVKIGSIFGAKYKNKAAFAGGVILVLMGLNILRG